MLRGSSRLLSLLAALGAVSLAVPGAQAGPGGRPATGGDGQASTADLAARIDALMEAAWTEARVTPAAPASDAEFLRRLHLDVTGVIPDEDTVRAFLASPAPDKRARLVRDALASDGFNRTMALRWAYPLVGRQFLFTTLGAKQVEQAAARLQEAMQGGGMSPMDGGMADDAPTSDGPVPPLVEWLEGRLRENTPWDAVVRELLTAEGSASENPATHWALRYARNGKAEELAGSAVRVFQGLQIQCAQCHDHPYTDWTQHDFYGVAAFFSRTAVRRDPPPEGSNKKQGPFVVHERPNRQLRIPAPPGETGRLALPRFLTGEVVGPGNGVDRRAELAKLMTSPANPYFAKATVNRVWSFFFGRGQIDPVDDLEAQDPRHPAVLDLLVADFKRSGHDLRRLCEAILLTRAYGLSSGGADGEAAEVREAQVAAFARAPLRSLSAEQLFYSVLAATGAEDVRTQDRRQRARLERTKLTLLRKFVQTFGDDEGQEVVDEGTIPQALLLLNGPLTNDAIRPRPGHPVYDRLFRMKSNDERIETIYLRTLGRMPAPAERAVLREALAAPEARTAAGQAQALSDVYWALLNSSEFAFNH